MLNNVEIKQWKDEGYLIKSNIIDNELKDKVSDFLESKECQHYYTNDFGSRGHKLEFPTGYIIDWISVNENIIICVKQLLNTDDILLIQSDAWKKENNNNENSDQRTHMDYGNNTFLHPSDWNDPETVALIVYFSDISETGGGTAVTPRSGEDDIIYKPPYINMPGYGPYDFYNDKKQAEEYMSQFDNVKDFRKLIYDREIITNPKKGDILFYRYDVWHRGTSVIPGKSRYVMNLLFKKKECYWINCWNPGFTKWMYYGFVEKLITEMSPEQRSVIGIPKPGDKYWNETKIQNLKARYPNINVSPYLENLYKNF